MNDIQWLSHTKWDCKDHVVWRPNCRRKMLYGQLRKNLGDVFHDLACSKEGLGVERHLQPDHVHMLLLISPKYSISRYTKGKSAIWPRDYFGSTVRAYISDQEKRDQSREHLTWFKRRPRYGGQSLCSIGRFERFRVFQAAGFAHVFALNGKIRLIFRNNPMQGTFNPLAVKLAGASGKDIQVFV